MPLTAPALAELARLPGDEQKPPPPPKDWDNTLWGRPILCTHRAWLARRSAELDGREPAAVSGEHPFDGRAK